MFDCSYLNCYSDFLSYVFHFYSLFLSTLLFSFFLSFFFLFSPGARATLLCAFFQHLFYILISNRFTPFAHRPNQGFHVFHKRVLQYLVLALVLLVQTRKRPATPKESMNVVDMFRALPF